MSATPPRKSDLETPPGKLAPGRPKDLAKRAAILDAAKQMFTQHGFDGVSMDQIAAAAGVSKLTVYSHFGDKEALFVEAVRGLCEELMPDLFVAVQDAFSAFLQARTDKGELDIPDIRRAASQFFCLLKGELHMRMASGLGGKPAQAEVDAHITATVDFFLRAYASNGRRAP
jgi:TetR/AcrR family transcriptional repressor of mexJK operon